MVSLPSVMGASISTDIDERVSAICTLARGTEESAGVSGSVAVGEVTGVLLCLFFMDDKIDVLAELLSVGSES
jgi:hypothetical protein